MTADSERLKPGSVIKIKQLILKHVGFEATSDSNVIIKRRREEARITSWRKVSQDRTRWNHCIN